MIHLTMAKGVTNIGQDAFASCENLTNLTIPRSVVSIKGYVFCAQYGLDCRLNGTTVTFDQKPK